METTTQINEDRSEVKSKRNSSHPQRPRSLRAVACALGLGAILAAGPAAAQFGGGGVITPEIDTNVASNELSRMLPNLDVKSYRESTGFLRWRTRKSVSLFAVTEQGISTRVWDSITRDWTNWDHLGNPSGVLLERISNSGDSPGIDFGLPMVSGWDLSLPDWIAFQGQAFESSNSQPDFEMASMQVDGPRGLIDSVGLNPTVTTAVASSLPSDWDYFNPQAGLETQDVTGKNQYRRHVFGTGMPRNIITSSTFVDAQRLPLIEYRKQTREGDDEWIDHGTPGDHTGVTVGPGSTASVIHDYLAFREEFDITEKSAEEHYVFVATDPVEFGSSGLNGPEIAYLKGDGGTFGWNSLGSPAPFVNGAPVAATYYTKAPYQGGLGRIVVAAVGRMPSGRYELLTQFHNGNGWGTGWQNHGAPAELSGGKFKMTSSVVWHEGGSNQMANLRVSFFGYSEQDGNQPGQLVEFHWNGSRWDWRPVQTAPGNRNLRTDHAVVVDEGARDRIIVPVRTYDGRIYEYIRDIQPGQAPREGWNDLSFEPRFQLINTSFGWN